MLEEETNRNWQWMDDRGREKGIRDDFSTFDLRSWVVMSFPEMKPERTGCERGGHGVLL